MADFKVGDTVKVNASGESSVRGFTGKVRLPLSKVNVFVELYNESTWHGTKRIPKAHVDMI